MNVAFSVLLLLLLQQYLVPPSPADNPILASRARLITVLDM